MTQGKEMAGISPYTDTRDTRGHGCMFHEAMQDLAFGMV